MTQGKVCPQCGTKYDAEHRFCTRDGATLVAENPNESLIGVIIADRYHILQKLGEGGMGEVYLAEHVRIKRKVAVKVMRRWMSADAIALGRFHREAENASQISHGNVATIYDFGETGDGMVYFAMEYVDGEPLSEILKREPRLGIVRATDIIRQVADALGAAHALGILHRDLKPDNVMIGKTRVGTDHVKMVDFGISRVMDRGTQRLTSTGMVIGTPDYMSPEQLSGDALDARADNYALALIAFRVLTGASAFGGNNAQESLLARLTKPAQRLIDAGPEVAWPEAMQLVFNRALASDPSARYAEASEFAVELEAAAATAPLTPDDQRYLQLLNQRGLTPARGQGAFDAATPPYGAPGVPGLTVPRSRAELGAPPVATHGAAASSPVPEVEQGERTGPQSSAAAAATPVPPAAVAPTPAAVARRISTRTMAIAGAAGVGVLLLILRFALAPADRHYAIAESEIAADVPSVPALPMSSADSSALLGNAAPPPATTSARPAPDGPRSDAVVSRFSRTVFAVSTRVGHGAAFLVDSTGLIVTSAGLVPSDRSITVQVDGTHRFRAPVLVTERGIAIAALPPRACRGCQVMTLATDSVGAASGDSVVAIGSPESSGRIRRGVLKAAAPARLTASFDVGSRHAGAPVARLDGTVIAMATRGSSGGVTLTSAATILPALMRARQARGTAAIDTTSLPVWPVKRIAESERGTGLSFTDKDIDVYRVRREGFEVLVMTPQVMAWRRALVRPPSTSPDNPFTVAPDRGAASGLRDPVQRWSEWDEYWRERRAVVIIDVSPESARPPFHGGAKLVEFRKGDVESMQLLRDGEVVAGIEEGRFQAVPDPERYGGRAVFHSGVVVLPPSAFATGSKFRIEIRDAARPGKPIGVDIPSRAIDRIRADLGGYLAR